MSGRRPTRMAPAVALLGLLAGDALAGDVDLAKSGAPAREGAGAWQGKTLSEVLAVEDIASIVLLKAITSAPSMLDLSNLRRMLRDASAAPLQAPAVPTLLQLGNRDSIWEAVLLMRSGEVFGLVVGPSQVTQDGRSAQGCLSSQSGERGCFDIPKPTLE